MVYLWNRILNHFFMIWISNFYSDFCRQCTRSPSRYPPWLPPSLASIIALLTYTGWNPPPLHSCAGSSPCVGSCTVPLSAPFPTQSLEPSNEVFLVPQWPWFAMMSKHPAGYNTEDTTEYKVGWLASVY